MLALVVSVDAEHAEIASDSLWGLGVLAVEERQMPDGSIELWTALGDDPDLDRVQFRWPWRLEWVDDAVVDTWREFAVPIVVEPDLVVIPAWLVADTPVQTYAIRIEPGPTFGLGDHPTSRLSLSALRRVIVAGDSVLDVGSGSGILAIGAVIFGAASAVGIDISPAAVPVGLANAIANGVERSVSFATTPLEQIVDQFDVVVANILAPTLIALSADLVRVTGTTLIISGLLADRYIHVVESLRPLVVESVVETDGWVAVTLRR